MQALSIEPQNIVNFSPVQYIGRCRVKGKLITRLVFNQQILNFSVMDFISNSVSPLIRPATINETFQLLRNSNPLSDQQNVVCLETGLEVGDDVLIIRKSGMAVVPALHIWSDNYSFSVAFLQ
jgi:hypothetical protein